MSLAGLNRVKRLFENREVMDPWEYLQEIVRYDRGPEHDEQWMTGRLQARWPGNYKVERIVDYQWQSVEYAIVFDQPEDETYFRLKWA